MNIPPVPPDPASAGHLFVTGSPPEAVFEIGMLLNEHPQVALGIERFTGVNRMADRFLLAPERLLNPLSAETKIRGELLYARLRERARDGGLALSGDVDPGYGSALLALEPRLSGARVVVVAGAPSPSPSGQWRATLRQARESERRWFSDRVFVIPFGEFVAGDRAWLAALLSFLGLPASDRLNALYEQIRAHAAAHPFAAADREDVALIEWLDSRAVSELRRHAGRVTPRGEDPPLTEAELASRVREREQLVKQRADGSEWPDQHDALEARYVDQVGEAVRRGHSLHYRSLTAAPGLPAIQLRVTLVCPEPALHQDGRIERLERLSGHLGRLCSLRLLARRPLVRPLPHVEVHTAEVFAADEISDCDVVVYPAELPGGAELASTTKAVALMDGFASPEDEQMIANLACSSLVLAASGRLCELAHGHGAKAIHFPLGLDLGVFAPGPPNEQRDPHVTAMIQAAPHMEWEQLSEAMVRIREARPEVEVTLFGGVPADGSTRFLLHPPIGVVANLLRSSAVHVTGFAGDGFSYLDAGALACGAALVSAGANVSSDFIVNDRSAVLAAPDPESVARDVLALLDDPARRARLAAAGGEFVRLAMPSSQDVARRLALILVRLAEGSRQTPASVRPAAPASSAESPDGAGVAPSGPAADQARSGAPAPPREA